MIAAAGMAGRYATAVHRFLRHPIDAERASAAIERRLRRRETAFLELLERGVLASPGNPYSRLFSHLGIELGDVASMVRSAGLDAALERLYDAGVRISLEQFRGDHRLTANGLELECKPEDFDNPLAANHFEVSSGGSRSAGRRVGVDLDSHADDAPYDLALAHAFEVAGRPVGVWFPCPPGVAGLKRVLMGVKTDMPVERWFSQTRRPGIRFPKDAFVLGYASAAARLRRLPLARPEYVPAGAPLRPAEWVAAKCAMGEPPMFIGTPSAAVRVCKAASDRGLDISGTFFRCGGEPLTSARAEIIEARGAGVACNYYITELGGLIGLACAEREAVDEVHLATDKLAVIQRERELGGGATVPALHYTTLLPSAPRILINAESDDYGELGRRDCSCPIEALGLGMHLHSIRSYEKLSSEGMNFLGADLELLMDKVLPARFGGGADDYQLVERESRGLTTVEVVASPRLGALEEASVVEAVLEFFAERGRAQRMMASVFEGAGTVRLARREPHVSRLGKVLPLHLEEASARR